MNDSSMKTMRKHGQHTFKVVRTRRSQALHSEFRSEIIRLYLFRCISVELQLVLACINVCNRNVHCSPIILTHIAIVIVCHVPPINSETVTYFFALFPFLFRSYRKLAYYLNWPLNPLIKRSFKWSGHTIVSTF